MQQTIKPLGIATNPSDYDCADGELAASFNIINEDGALRPLPQPQAVPEFLDDDGNSILQSGDNILCIHATSAFKHYIATCEDENNVNNTIAWYDPNADYDEENPRPSLALPNVTHIYKVTPIGNTLAVLTDSGLYYLLWKYDNTNNATYTNLGSKPPFLDLQFGVSHMKWADTAPSIYYTGSMKWDAVYTDLVWDNPPSDSQDRVPFNNDDAQTITDTAWAVINRSNAKITEANRFYAPFIVRYCYRMSDGSLFMHSAPVFMPITSPYQYLAKLGITGTRVYVKYYYNNVALRYCAHNAAQLTELKDNWGDIVKSVDIFVSLPLIRENDSKKIESAAHSYDSPLFYSDNNIIATSEDTSERKLNIPMLYSETEYWDKIKSTSDFYKIASYDLADTNDTTRLIADNAFHDVYIRSGVLSTLATQEAMTDDYHSHNDVLPTIEDNRCITSLFNYNNRLSIAAPSERLFKGFSLETMLPAASNTPQFSDIRAIVVHIRTEQGIKRVVYQYDNPLSSVSLLLISSLPLFYPDNRAFAMDVYITHPGQQPQGFRLPMKQHPLLNGATTNGALITSLTDMPVINPRTVGNVPTPNDTLTTLNQIRTSEVDNPFYYPAINYKRVGVGTILALSTSAKALSQGQFGQHPLYAFCTDGVWALGVDTTDGTFVPAQPFTRDVCSNPDSILQLDSTVLFPTDRGIMLVSGSQTQCITEKLDYPYFNIIDGLPQITRFLPIGMSSTPNPMRDYIKDCKMIYDYQNQHVMVFNPAYVYAYVYSLKSGMWAMMFTDIISGEFALPSHFVGTLNAYPKAMAVAETDNGNVLVQYPDPSETSDPSTPTNSQFLVTRPFKLGSNDHKTITALVQHGMIENRQHVKLILYGSRDLATWHVVGSSTTNTLRGLSGTPYTAFRLAVIADLSASESLSDFSVEFTPKHTRVLR